MPVFSNQLTASLKEEACFHCQYLSKFFEAEEAEAKHCAQRAAYAAHKRNRRQQEELYHTNKKSICSSHLIGLG